MAGGRPSRAQRGLEQVEEELRQIVLQHKVEWQSAPVEIQAVARQSFLSALQTLATFVVDGKLPANYKKHMRRSPPTQLKEAVRAAKMSGG